MLIQIYIQQDATFTLFIYLWKLLYMFRVVSPPIIRSAYYLQHLVLVKPLLLPVTIVEGLERSSNPSTIATGSSNGFDKYQML